MGKGSCGQSITAPLCHAFLFRLFLCSTMGSLPWLRVLQEIVTCPIVASSMGCRWSSLWLSGAPPHLLLLCLCSLRLTIFLHNPLCLCCFLLFLKCVPIEAPPAQLTNSAEAIEETTAELPRYQHLAILHPRQVEGSVLHRSI